jgi:glycosyltransferase involved in cell wall biosynthesis
MNVLVLNTKGPFQWGGAELLARSLVEALRRAGVRADLLEVPHFQWPATATLDAIRNTVQLEIGETNFGPIDRVITLKFPAYLVQHPCKVLWLLHQFRQVYDLWDEPGVGFSTTPGGEVIRRRVLEADTRAMAEHRLRFTISGVVRDRLRRFNGFEAEVLYPPPPDDVPLYSAGDEPYFLYPARITPAKRQTLIVDALAHTRHEVRVHFVGGAEVEGLVGELQARAVALGVADRVIFDAWVEDHVKRDLLARCRGVVYTPRLEDYGYAPLEAALAGKPVVTCTDSGGPGELLGPDCCVLAEPDARSVAHALDSLWDNAPRRSTLGRAARDRVTALGINWPRTVERLLAPLP